MTNQNTKRAIPTVQEFYKTKKTVDTYTSLLLRSSLNMETQERYFNSLNVSISEVADELGVTRKTFYNHVETLIKGGFVRKEDTKYIFSKDHLYTLVEKETLKFLINTSNQYVIAVYAELTWRLRDSQGKGYQCLFTHKGIINSLGLRQGTTNNEKVRDILKMLHNNGLIEWSEYYKKENGVVKRIMVLTKVETLIKQPVIEEVEADLEAIEAEAKAKINREKFIF